MVRQIRQPVILVDTATKTRYNFSSGVLYFNVQPLRALCLHCGISLRYDPTAYLNVSLQDMTAYSVMHGLQRHLDHSLLRMTM